MLLVHSFFALDLLRDFGAVRWVFVFLLVSLVLDLLRDVAFAPLWALSLLSLVLDLLCDFGVALFGGVFCFRCVSRLGWLGNGPGLLVKLAKRRGRFPTPNSSKCT